MTVPAYLEPNGNAAIPSRLRPEAGGTLSIVLVPRPPIGVATLANARQDRVASVAWIDDDGTSHLEPIWLLVELPEGAAVPTPNPELDVLVDRYSGSFVRIRASSAVLEDGATHPFRIVLGPAGPGGAVFASTAELRAMGASSPAWYDANGTLGKVRDQGGRDVMAPTIADAVDRGLVAFGHLDKTTDPTHPALVLDHAPGEIRRRATLGDLVSVLEPARVLDLHDVGNAELDVVGAHAYQPPTSSNPDDPWSSGVTVAELARALAVALPASGQGAVLDRLQLAIATAEDAIGTYTGRKTRRAWDDPVPAGARTAVLQVATRVYRASDVTFGVLQTELGTTYTGRWITPEVSLALLGKRKSFGIA